MMEDIVPSTVRSAISGLPATIPLYYEDSYLCKFDSNVLKIFSFEDKKYVVLERTCFFPEGGGQLGDVGFLSSLSGRLKVVDTQAVNDVIVHVAVPLNGEVKEGEPVHGSIDWKVRYERMKNHTGSHVVFSSARKVLGVEGLMYMGVQIGGDKSRIDISYGKPISSDELAEMERLSNKICLENRKVKTFFTTREEAEHTYGKMLGVTEVTPSGRVRVVEIEGWDAALCCGTHVTSTAELGLIKILNRFRLQKGVERIEFSAGEYAYKQYEKAMQTLSELAQILRVPTENIVNRVSLLLTEKNILKEEIEKIKNQLVEANAAELLKQATTVGGFRFLSQEVKGVEVQELKRISTTLTEKDEWIVVILGSKAEDKVFMVGAAGQKAVERGINMYDLMKDVAKTIGGGGGTAKIAQAGGKNVMMFDHALQQYTKTVLTKLRSFLE
jgi:alanyl-tRNA synthetase